MYMKFCLVAVMATGLLLEPATVPYAASAAVSDLSSGNSSQRSPAASMNADYMQVAQRRGGGGGRGGARSRGARPSGGGNANRNANRNVNKNANRNVNKNANRNVNKNTNRNVNRNVNVNVNVKTRGHGWRGARWGAIAFGVTMGAVIVVAANTPPYPPDPSLCWTWSNASLTQGYWYYCSGS